MPFIRGGSAALYVGPHDLTSFTNNASVSMDAGLVESTTFGDTARDYAPGTRKATVTASGFLDETAYSAGVATAGSFDILSDRITAAAPGVLASTNTVDTTWGYQPITLAWAGNTAGNTCFVGSVAESSFEVGATVGELVSFAANFSCTAAWDTALLGTKGTTQTGGFSNRGVLLAPLSSGYSVVGLIGSEHDNGASTANGVIINLHGQKVGTAGTLTVRVEHSTSAGGVGATVVATFSNLTSGTGPQGQSLIIPGTINRYVRAYLVSSMTGGQTIAVSYARL